MYALLAAAQSLEIWDPPPINFDQGDWWLALLLSWVMWRYGRTIFNGGR